MNTSKKKIMMTGSILLVMMTIVSMSAVAMGNSEKPYGIELDQEFADIVAELESGDMELQTAIDQLHELRTANNRENSADYGEMERLMTSVRDREMTALQAREQLCLLDEAQTDCTAQQLRERDRTLDQLKTQTQDRTKISAPETPAGTGTAVKAQSGSGNSSSGKSGAEAGGSQKGK